MFYLTLLLLFSYAVGNISFGLISARLFNLQDPRTFGSKNIGATNILRSGNKKAALFTLCGDMLKGLLLVCFARWILNFFNIAQSDNTHHYLIFLPTVEYLTFLCGFLVFLGHVFPVMLKFKGGKGVATASGVLLALNWYIGLLVILVWVLIAYIFRYSSLAAICACLFALIATYIQYQHTNIFGVYIIACMVCIVLYKHKLNIKNLMHGTESKIGQKNV
jgi:acyl phosphate:glycerol-3-phosphate acyltransferase